MSFENDFTGLMRKKETETDPVIDLEIGIGQRTQTGQKAVTAEERTGLEKGTGIGVENEIGNVIVTGIMAVR